MALRSSLFSSSFFTKLFKLPQSCAKRGVFSNSLPSNSRVPILSKCVPESDSKAFNNVPSSSTSALSSHLNLRPQFSSKPLLGLYLFNGFLHVHPSLQGQQRFYQAALRPRLICPGCYYVWRHGRKHVECSDHPRHKQMKRVSKRKMWKEDYTKGKWENALDWHRILPRQAQRHVDHTAMSHNWLAGKLGREL